MFKITIQIDKYLNYCKSIRQMSLNTLNNKRAILNQFVKNTEIASVTELDNQVYNKWLELELGHHLSPASVNIYNSTIVSFLKFHQNAGLEITFDFNSVPYFRAAKTSRKFYTDSEISQVLKCAGESEGLMIAIMFETGMRIAEIASLKIENFEHNKISFIGKGSKKRVVYLSSKTFKNFRTYIKKYHIYNGYIWCVLDGAKTLNSMPPSINTIRKRLQMVFKKAGFKGFYPHALRHSFATNLQKKGASIVEIKEMMGHSSIATTERYLHGFDGRLEELFKKYQ